MHYCAIMHTVHFPCTQLAAPAAKRRENDNRSESEHLTIKARVMIRGLENKSITKIDGQVSSFHVDSISIVLLVP